VLAFVCDWIKAAAYTGFESAMGLLDRVTDGGLQWSDKLFKQVSFGHMEKGVYPTITDPDDVPNLRREVYRYNDGSGLAVDYDLPLDGKRSDFTIQFEFLKAGEFYKIHLRDIHVL
jgi:hypothetical protein